MILKIVIVLSMLLVLAYYIKQMRKQKIRFNKKRNKLLNTIQSTREKQIYLNQKIKLSEEFDKNYTDSRNKIGQSIYEANYEMLKSISDRK